MARWGAFRGRTKFNNRPTRCREGVAHQSMLEARWCDDLHTLQAGGRIRELCAHPQPRLRLVVNEIEVTTYVPDFRYTDCDTGQEVIADAKGRPTPEYTLKKRLVLALLGVEVQELRNERGRR